MSTRKIFIFTIFGILVLALAVAEAAPTEWKFCEFVLLSGGIIALRELVANHRAESEMRRTRGGAPAYAPVKIKNRLPR
jgi:hypothetical protein